MAGEGGSSELRVVIFAISLVMIFSLMIAGVSGVFYNKDAEPRGVLNDKNWMIGDLVSLNWWNNVVSPGNLTDIYPGRAGTYWIPPTAGDVLWSGSGLAVREDEGNPLVSYTTDARAVVWEGPSDDLKGDGAIHLYHLNDGSWIAYRESGLWDRFWQVITPYEIAMAVDEDDIAKIQLNVGVKATLIFYFPLESDAKTVLESLGPYKMGVGQYISDQMAATSGVVDALLGLLSFNLQATGVWWIDMIFSTIIWAAILWVGVVAISKLIPFL